MRSKPAPILTVMAALALLAQGSLHAVVNFDWATVGDTGNAADPLNSGSLPGIGSVATVYNIATTEVNLIQYTEFLNAVDPNGLNPNSLYNGSMATELNIAGISFTSVAAAGSKYAVIGSGLRPVTYVSWNDSARFVNWLHNGQGSGSTESGVYDMSLGMPTRSSTAGYWIPSEDEWYKAAYYDPSVSGPSDDYWLYPTSSDSAPGNVVGAGANRANYKNAVFSVTQSVIHDSNQNYLTDGGAFSTSPSFYGTYDQGGNVFEWNDTVIAGSFRGLRGGSWFDGENSLRSSSRALDGPSSEFILGGFRVASVPEPSTSALLLLGGATLFLNRRRKG
ncbi:MAG: formylglycine-generating enzyme family protein [Terrimicrobiaceae bacterium]